ANHFGVSLLGAAWIFFSGFTQWWYSNQQLPESIGWIALLVVATHYLALSRRPATIALAALAVFVGSVNFALALYPPSQVPLAYLAVAIVAGWLVPRLRLPSVRPGLGLRLGAAVLAVAGVALVLFTFYRDARRAVELMRATLYPGARLVTGGDLGVAQ